MRSQGDSTEVHTSENLNEKRGLEIEEPMAPAVLASLRQEGSLALAAEPLVSDKLEPPSKEGPSASRSNIAKEVQIDEAKGIIKILADPDLEIILERSSDAELYEMFKRHNATDGRFHIEVDQEGKLKSIHGFIGEEKLFSFDMPQEEGQAARFRFHPLSAPDGNGGSIEIDPLKDPRLYAQLWQAKTLKAEYKVTSRPGQPNEFYLELAPNGPGIDPNFIMPCLRPLWIGEHAKALDASFDSTLEFIGNLQRGEINQGRFHIENLNWDKTVVSVVKLRALDTLVREGLMPAGREFVLPNGTTISFDSIINHREKFEEILQKNGMQHLGPAIFAYIAADGLENQLITPVMTDFMSRGEFTAYCKDYAGYLKSNLKIFIDYLHFEGMLK